jgi:hypothetical protein
VLRAPLAVGLVLVFVAGGLAAPAHAAGTGTVLINELANGGPGSTSDSFFELRNWGSTDVDLTGWHVFRCSGQGLRSNVGRPESDLTGVVLGPGEIYTVSKSGMPGDAHITQPFAATGFGLYLEGPDAALVDAVGVYPNEPWPTQSECTVGRNLPNSLDFLAGESWQRTSTTGYIVAPSTIGEQNATAPAARAGTGVVISEVAPSAGDFVELQNTGRETEEIGGWLLYRCTATGRITADSLEATIPAGTALGPGEYWTADDVRLADVTFGVKLVTEAGLLVDRVSVSDHADSACQTGDHKLPAIADAVAGESYQRTTAGFIVAPRTPGAANATKERSVFREEFDYPASPGVAISEIATDPVIDGRVQRNYIELGNYGAKAVDIGGWTVRRCEASGMRSLDPQFTVPKGTTLGPGAVYLAAREGTDAASGADATYPVSLNFLGTGVWVADADGDRVDSAGIYAANEMDSSNITGSPCTLGVALTTYLPDRMLGETFQRTRFTGSNLDDYLARPATPGTIDLVNWVDPTERVVTSSTAALDQARRGHSAPRVIASDPAIALAAWSGVTESGPLATLVGENETVLDASAPAPVTDDAWGYPYVRFTLDAAALAAGSTIGWTGITAPGDEVQLSVWNGTAWRLLQSGSGQPMALGGTLEAGDIVDGVVTLLVQDGPRTQSTLVSGRDGQLEDPADYDFAITHITDTQYLSESYPEVYTQLASWIADNKDSRKIAFAQHTGDLVQNWVDPDQSEVRARIEFERASAIQSILDDAGVPNGVLPGNHDNKRGVDDSLFNEYVPPSRYEGTDWYGASIAPGDNSANFSTFEWEGARFLMLALPYAYGEREIAWAETVVAEHPDFNIIVATHEHVMPKTVDEDAHRSTNSRWVSHGGQLWERVIAPHRNVLFVLSGHFHGIGQLVTEDAGGIEGHTVVELLADYQEFRTHTGERATGFYRMLQFDLDGGAVAVDTRSVRLSASYSADYDYRQFLPDNGLASSPSNARPWNIVDEGVQGRYDEADDEFTALAGFQHPKVVATTGLWTGAAG